MTLIEAARTTLPRQHYSPRTEETYLHWIREFVRFHHQRHPRTIGAPVLKLDMPTLQDIQPARRPDLLGRSGSIEWAQLAASALTSAAQKEFPLAFAGASDGPDLDFVRALVNYLVERDV